MSATCERWTGIGVRFGGLCDINALVQTGPHNGIFRILRSGAPRRDLPERWLLHGLSRMRLSEQSAEA